MIKEKGTTANNFELSLCSYCHCMTKSVRVEPFVFFCFKCGHDKSLGDVLQHEAKMKLNNVNPLVEQIAKQFIDLELEKIKKEERARIKAEWTKLRKYLDDNYGITLEDEKSKFNEFEKVFKE